MSILYRRRDFSGLEDCGSQAAYGVFGLVHNAHTSAAEFFQDAVVRKCLADERGGIRHRMAILGLLRQRVEFGQVGVGDGD
jgi:hypothetical protein